MNLFALVPFLAAFVFATAEEDKHHHRPDCQCSKEESIAAALARQAQLQECAKACDYSKCLELSLPEASFSTVDQFCADGSCCNDLGSMEQWWTYYACPDNINYAYQPAKVTYVNNGTVIVSKTELASSYDYSDYDNWTRQLFAYQLNYYWVPVQSDQKCDFRLSFISGHSYNCPEFIPNAVKCDNPACVGAGLKLNKRN